MNTNKQDEFLLAAESGKNIFLTGKAGTGKSYITQQFMELLKEKNKNIVALAPTGVLKAYESESWTKLLKQLNL